MYLLPVSVLSRELDFRIPKISFRLKRVQGFTYTSTPCGIQVKLRENAPCISVLSRELDYMGSRESGLSLVDWLVIDTIPDHNRCFIFISISFHLGINFINISIIRQPKPVLHNYSYIAIFLHLYHAFYSNIN